MIKWCSAHVFVLFLRLPLKTALSCGRGYFWDLPACTSCLSPTDTHSLEDPRMRVYLPGFPPWPTHLQQLSLFHPPVCLFVFAHRGRRGKMRSGAACLCLFFFFFVLLDILLSPSIVLGGGSRELSLAIHVIISALFLFSYKAAALSCAE